MGDQDAAACSLGNLGSFGTEIPVAVQICRDSNWRGLFLRWQLLPPGDVETKEIARATLFAMKASPRRGFQTES